MQDRPTEYEKLIDLVSDSTVLTFRLYYVLSFGEGQRIISTVSLKGTLISPSPSPSLQCPHAIDERVDGWLQIHSVLGLLKYHTSPHAGVKSLSEV